MFKTSTMDPDAFVNQWSESVEKGDFDGLLEMYEEDAVFIPEPGRVVTGLDNIRAELQALTGLDELSMTFKCLKAIEAGDTAICSYRWHMTGIAPDGSPVDLTGVSTDISRRREDGSWGVIVDDPYGGEPNE